MKAGPNYLIIGAAKSGTTALSQYLSQHPEVFVSEPKEPHYLALGGARPTYTGPGDESTINAKSVWRSSDYQRLFASSARLTAVGEGSVSTLYYGETSIEQIRKDLPEEIRLICILRNPTNRAWSAYNYLRSRGFEVEDDFERALGLEDERIASGFHHMWHYKNMGYYGRQLALFMDAFGPDQILVHTYDDFKANPDSVLSKTFRFLGVDSDFRPPVVPSPHRSGKPRSRKVARFLNTESSSKRVARKLVPSATRRRARGALVTASTQRVEMESRVRRDLTAHFEEDVKALERLVERDLSSWRCG